MPCAALALPATNIASLLGSVSLVRTLSVPGALRLTVNASAVADGAMLTTSSSRIRSCLIGGGGGVNGNVAKVRADEAAA